MEGYAEVLMLYHNGTQAICRRCQRREEANAAPTLADIAEDIPTQKVFAFMDKVIVKG
jgi:hypothetical protein